MIVFCLRWKKTGWLRIFSLPCASLIVAGDVTNIPALNMANPGWQLAFDAIPDMAEAGRRKLMDQVVADKSIMTGYHWGLPGAGTIQKDGSGYAMVPVKV